MAPASSAFVDFLLTKIINAKHATRKSESFVTIATRARKEQLKQLVDSFVTTTPLDSSSSGVRFSFISLGGKKKERLAPHPLAYLQSAGALTWSVTVRDPRTSVAVACRLAVSGELLVLIEEAGRKVVFHCSCRDVIGWNTAHGSIQVFYQHGLCVAFSTRDGRWEDSQEITQRLKVSWALIGPRPLSNRLLNRVITWSCDLSDGDPRRCGGRRDPEEEPARSAGLPRQLRGRCGRRRGPRFRLAGGSSPRLPVGGNLLSCRGNTFSRADDRAAEDVGERQRHRTPASQRRDATQVSINQIYL